ncbi:YitT family protein [Longirhabdus pacifica]|uniref:YitT family protein n=1 Tax=Longirhabdus pacifica TaxID=2305227 RepID=UPI001009035C|nr:YitT family protein [Longirhabdus pacifica]
MNLKLNVNMLWKQLIPIMIGTAIYAAAIHLLVIPNELMEGGVTGISLLINYALDIPPSYTTLLINIPLFYVGWRFIGKASMGLTIFGTLSLSFFLWVIEFLMSKGLIMPPELDDVLLVTLYAGVATGVGLGLVFRFGGTTGGADIIARLGNKTRGWSMGQVLLTIDALVLTTSAFYIHYEKIFYTLILVFVAARIIDFIQEGEHRAKAFTIISEQAPMIAERIQSETERGVTIFSAKGGYKLQPKDVVYCVVYRQEVRKVKLLVKQLDPKAFLIINDVHDVLGEGFKTE